MVSEVIDLVHWSRTSIKEEPGNEIEPNYENVDPAPDSLCLKMETIQVDYEDSSSSVFTHNDGRPQEIDHRDMDEGLFSCKTAIRTEPGVEVDQNYTHTSTSDFLTVEIKTIKEENEVSPSSTFDYYDRKPEEIDHNHRDKGSMMLSNEYVLQQEAAMPMQPPMIDQTTLLQNKDESFVHALLEQRVSHGPERRIKAKRRRKLIVDKVINISAEEIKFQLSDTTDIVTTLNLAFPINRLMPWIESGRVEKLFSLPGYNINSKHTSKFFQRHLTTKSIENQRIMLNEDAENDEEEQPALSVNEKQELLGELENQTNYSMQDQAVADDYIQETCQNIIDSAFAKKMDKFVCELNVNYYKTKKMVKTQMSKPTHQKAYECDVCHKCFDKSSDLRNHMRIHTAEKPFKCTVCHKCFKQSSDLKIHMFVHTKEKPFECTFCRKCFNQNSNLKTHMRLHTKEKPFECTVCHKCFVQSCNLKTHMRVHICEKPFKCDICHKCFTIKKYLADHHMRVHTKEKPFKCDICHKCFTREKYLAEHHMRVHTKEKPFECDVCHKNFALKCNLKDHMRIHTKEKPFECTVCHKCFNQNSNLKTHMRLHAGVT